MMLHYHILSCTSQRKGQSGIGVMEQTPSSAGEVALHQDIVCRAECGPNSGLPKENTDAKEIVIFMKAAQSHVTL